MMVSDVGHHVADQLVVARGQQVVRRHQRGVRRRNLVAVHAVGQPQHRRHIGHQPLGFRRRSLARIVEPFHGRANLRQALDVGLRSDDRVDQLAALPGLAVLEHLHPIRFRRRQRIEIAHDVGMAADAVAEIVPQHLSGRRHGGVVGRARPEFELRLGKRRQCENREENRFRHEAYRIYGIGRVALALRTHFEIDPLLRLPGFLRSLAGHRDLQPVAPCRQFGSQGQFSRNQPDFGVFQVLGR